MLLCQTLPTAVHEDKTYTRCSALTTMSTLEPALATLAPWIVASAYWQISIQEDKDKTHSAPQKDIWSLEPTGLILEVDGQNPLILEIPNSSLLILTHVIAHPADFDNH